MYSECEVKSEQDAIRLTKSICKDLKTERHGQYSLYNCGAGFDTETSQYGGYAFCYIWQLMVNGQFVYGRHLKYMKLFFDILDDQLDKVSKNANRHKKKNSDRLIIWDANLGYEWAFCKTYWNEIGISKLFAKDERHPLQLQIGKHLEFRECLGLFGVSLANIAKNYTVTQKAIGDLDFTLCRNSYTEIKADEWTYIYNDVKILDELGIIALKKFKNNIPLTATGIIRNTLKEKINSKPKGMENAKELVKRLFPANPKTYDIIMNLLFCGGWAHSNILYVGQVLENCVKCADLTSDYPAQANHHSFPAGSLIGNCTVEDMTNAPHWYAQATFYELKTTCDHSLISEHKCLEYENIILDNGRLYYAKKVTLYINEIDLSNIIKIYKFDDVEFSDCHIFTESKRAPPELLDVMNEAYLKKHDLKEKGLSNTIEYTESKKVVNGCFGMCATRLYLDECFLEDGEIVQKPTEKSYEELASKVYLSPWIAVYITSYARSIICHFVAKYPDKILQYDTDSIYYLYCEEIENELLEYNEKIKKINITIFGDNPAFYDLGAWDIDKKCYKRFKCLGAKRYLKEKQNGYIDPVIAGCNKTAFIARYAPINQIQDEIQKGCNNVVLSDNSITYTGDDDREWKVMQQNALPFVQAYRAEIKNKTIIISDCEVDVFDIFDNHFHMWDNLSRKTCVHYRKKSPKIKMIDYQGNEQTEVIPSCAVIKNIPFKIKISQSWLDYANFLKRDRTKRSPA